MRAATSALLTLGLALAPEAWAQDSCPEGQLASNNEIFDEALADAEGVLGSDKVVQRLPARLGAVNIELACELDVLTPELAMRYHLVQLVNADPFGDQTSRPAVKDIARRLRDLQGGEHAKELLPEGHGILGALERPSDPTTTETLKPPRFGYLSFDGTQGLERPTNAPTILQIVGEDGVVHRSTYLQPRQSVPDYEIRPVLRPALTWASLGSGALAGGLMLTSAALAGPAVKDAPDFRTTNPSVVGTTRALGGIGIALGVVSLGSAAGAVAVGAR